jgi:hypothetical protein
MTIMIKKTCTLLLLFSVAISFGQSIILQKNTNPKAQELKHNLNKTRDSLMMASDNTIFKVEIFNEDFEKVIIVEGLESHIPLTNLPSGKFVVEVQLSDKIIVMHLVRPDYCIDMSNSNKTSGEKPIADAKHLSLAGTKNKNLSQHSIEFLLSGRKPKQTSHKNQNFYWTLVKVNTGNTSSKTMRLANQKTVDKIISKHNLEIKTSIGERNELIIWEVYNRTKFMQYQIANPDYINSSVSDLFNVSPYYTSQNNIK